MGKLKQQLSKSIDVNIEELYLIIHKLVTVRVIRLVIIVNIRVIVVIIVIKVPVSVVNIIRLVHRLLGPTARLPQRIRGQKLHIRDGELVQAGPRPGAGAGAGVGVHGQQRGDTRLCNVGIIVIVRVGGKNFKAKM